MSLRVQRLACAALAIVATVLVAPSAASASSIVYIKDYNVWQSSPDGSVQRQMTTNGAAGSKAGFHAPSQADDGTIVAVAPAGLFASYNQDGSEKWAAVRNEAGVKGYGTSSTPYDAQVSATGNQIVYGYIYSTLVPATVYPRVTMQNANTDWAVGPGYNYSESPRWIYGHVPYAGMVDYGPNAGLFVMNDTGGTTGWVEPPAGYSFSTFDLNRSGTQIIAELVPEGSTKPSVLALFQQNGAPPGTATLVCMGPNLSTTLDGVSRPRWSPDGTQFVYTDEQGVEVSPAPTNGGGTCSISSKLIAAGADEADFGVPTVPGPNPNPNPNPNPKPTPATFTLAKPKVLSSGEIDQRLTAKVAGTFTAIGTVKAGAIRIAKTKTVTYGTGKATLKRAGSVTLKLKPTSAAKKALKRGKTLKVTIKITFKPSAAGSKAVTKTETITVRGKK